MQEEKQEALAERGKRSFEWVRLHMPAFHLAELHVLEDIKKSKKNPFQGLRISACLHVSKETSVLIHSLNSFGAKINLVAANPLSSQADIASFLSDIGVDVFARKGETVQEYKSQILQAAKAKPSLIVDDGGELHVAYSRTKSRTCFGGTDETTSGTTRLKALAGKKMLRYSVIAVNEAKTKHLFDNKYGTGQSAMDGLLRATGLLLSGKKVVVAGYGWVGSGVASRARGLGARVIVTEVHPLRALEAFMEGFEVLAMEDAARIGDMFLTCTGQTDVLTTKHFELMKDGAILGNVGHFDREIDIRSLFAMGTRVEQAKENIAKIQITKSKSLYLISQGRVVNLAAAEGHPPEIMQLSFANQLLSLYYLAKNRGKLGRGRVLAVPEEIDNMVSGFALKAFGIRIDRLSQKQKRYSRSFVV